VILPVKVNNEFKFLLKEKRKMIYSLAIGFLEMKQMFDVA
jgi:hypothetical protein